MDQCSLAFMLDNRKWSKVKNNMMHVWKLEMASFCYTAKYRPSKDYVAPDSFTQVLLSAIPASALDYIHKALCHPGVTRMLHFIWSKKLPYLTDDVKRKCSGCSVCVELKLQFYRPIPGSLIKAAQPME